MTKRLLIVALGFLFVFCKQKTVLEEKAQYEVSNQIISLTADSNLKTRIALSKASQEEYSFDMLTAGIVRSIPNNYAEMAPPFAGRILKNFVRLGQKVQPGTPVFEISSPDYFEAQKDYFDAKQEFKQAELNLKRQRDLLANGVGIQQEVEEAETDFSTKKAAFTNAGAALKIFSINPDQLTLGQPLVVRSPIAGEVIDNAIVIGQYVKEDAEPLAIIAALEKLRIAAKVKEKDLKHLAKLNQVHIELSAYPGESIEGTIYHVNDIVDEDTRSIEVLIEVNNVDRKLKPGMYVNVRFVDQPEPVIFVPTKAVLQNEESIFVFVAVGPDQYQRRAVVTAGISGDRTAVLQGLKAGEQVVSEGGIYLLQAN